MRRTIYTVMQRLRPERIAGIKIKGRIIEADNQELKFKIIAKSERSKEELRDRVQKVKKTKDNLYQKPYFDNLEITLIYLTEESLKGLYKDPKKNLPYEIVDGAWNTIYRQDAQKKYRKKEDIFNELEKAAIDEGLGNVV